ncbi:sensor histidine kinase [Paenibacillus sp. IB182496]|uniref:Sensor histidine kinase n=1 Tax=Paenibacillus sabuli TaxID=2772509 RepID=A0A927BXE6_9BACL|nr:sensor histidine kinase [Paenibacillus sabuli]MBD2848122.1 sensor histidine kinase [Paenibacillus sabuli]
MKALTWIRNMPLKRKLVLLFAAVGLVPLVLTFFISYNELHKSLADGQNYAANRTYEQTLTALSNLFGQMEEVSAMMIVNEDINALLARRPGEMPIPEQLSAYDNIYAYTRILETNMELQNIMFFVDDAFVITGEDALFRPIGSLADDNWAAHIRARRGSPTWGMYEDRGRGPARTYLTLGRMLWNPNDLAEPVGIVSIGIALGQIRQTMAQSVPEQVVYLETGEGELVTGSGEERLAQLRLPMRPGSSGGFREVALDGETVLARDQQVGNTNLYLVSVMSQRAATAAIDQVRLQLIAMYGAISLLLLLCIVLITRSITRRVYQLMNRMSQVRQGRLRPLDIAPSEDEIGQLVSSYNYMIASVQDLLREQFRLGQEKKGAELKALQSQINPHFLYNTLDMINWMAVREERDNLREVVYALSDYYKLVLNKGEDVVTVADELRLCSIYMDIQRKRLKNRVTLQVDVHADALACLLPKITLQPLVENAIVHGILEKPEGEGDIRIVGNAAHGRLHLEVRDDGVGMRGQAPDASRNKGSGYGMGNIANRLALYFGEDGGIRPRQAEDGGTRIVLDVPAVRAESAFFTTNLKKV